MTATGAWEIVANALMQRGVSAGNLTSDYDYIKSGHVDSLSLLRFIIELETALGVSISNEDIVSPEFRTAGGLVALLERKMQ